MESKSKRVSLEVTEGHSTSRTTSTHQGDLLHVESPEKDVGKQEPPRGWGVMIERK